MSTPATLRGSLEAVDQLVQKVNKLRQLGPDGTMTENYRWPLQDREQKDICAAALALVLELQACPKLSKVDIVYVPADKQLIGEELD